MRNNPDMRAKGSKLGLGLSRTSEACAQKQVRSFSAPATDPSWNAYFYSTAPFFFSPATVAPKFLFLFSSAWFLLLLPDLICETNAKVLPLNNLSSRSPAQIKKRRKKERERERERLEAWISRKQITSASFHFLISLQIFATVRFFVRPVMEGAFNETRC